MLDPEADLIKGLCAKWAASTGLAGIDGPYYGETPEGTALPRCVLTCLPAVLKVTTGSSRIYEATAQFRLYDDQPEQTSAHATAVAEVFRAESLALPGLANTTLVNHRLVRSSVERPDVNVACSIVEFLFVLQQARG